MICIESICRPPRALSGPIEHLQHGIVWCSNAISASTHNFESDNVRRHNVIFGLLRYWKAEAVDDKPQPWGKFTMWMVVFDGIQKRVWVSCVSWTSDSSCLVFRIKKRDPGTHSRFGYRQCLTETRDGTISSFAIWKSNFLDKQSAGTRLWRSFIAPKSIFLCGLLRGDFEMH